MFRSRARIRPDRRACLLGLIGLAAAACSGDSGETARGEPATPALEVPPPRPLVLNDADRIAPSPARSDVPVLTDIEGTTWGTLSRADTANPKVLFFVRSDCPISNQYGPEIRRICADYGEAGVDCFLVYVDPAATDEDIRRHTEDFGHTLPAIPDTARVFVNLAGATITPEVAVFSKGEIAYRGRIDNLYEDLGRPRRVVTRHELRDALTDLSASRPVATPRTQATGCFIE
jgi:hypothetical protein